VGLSSCIVACGTGDNTLNRSSIFNTLVLSGYQPYLPHPVPNPPLDPSLCHTHSPTNWSSLIQAIKTHTALGLSDGSYMPKHYPNKGSAAWLLADPLLSLNNMFYGVVAVGGPGLQINTYQAKLQGLHTLLTALEWLCLHFEIYSGGIMIGCNNKGAVHQAQSFNK